MTLKSNFQIQDAVIVLSAAQDVNVMMIIVDVTKIVPVIVTVSWNAVEIVMLIFAVSLCSTVILQVCFVSSSIC